MGVWLVRRFQREAEAARRAAAEDKQKMEFEIASMRVYPNHPLQLPATPSWYLHKQNTFDSFTNLDRAMHYA